MTNLRAQIQISCQSLLATNLPAAIRPTRTAAVYHRIDVTDNGIGFDEKYLSRIFQFFSGCMAGASIPAPVLAWLLARK